MSNTPNLSLPYIDVNAAQREVVHNDAIRGLDALVQLAVLDRDLATPPGSPSDGERWLVAASPTGAWAGHATHVAAWQDGAWRFYEPRIGWFVYVVDEGALIAWSGSAWIDAMAMLSVLQNMALLGVGTVADATNPFSAKLNNALWTAQTVAEGGDGHLRYKLSKEAAAKTLSLLMQTNFSGRAEVGLTGDDDLHVKVSPDGTTWFEGLTLACASGQVRLGIDGTAAAPALSFASDTDNGAYRIGTNNWGLAAGGAKIVDIGTTGLGIAGTLTVSGLITATAGQIAFPATQNASAAANTLDDYEEGTWTPTLTFATPGNLAVAYTLRAGFYTKIGRAVFLSTILLTSTFTHTTASGGCQVTGLPFAAANLSSNHGYGTIQWQGITKANYTQWTAALVAGTSALIYNGSGSGQAVVQLAAADMPTTGTVQLNGALTYFAAT